MAEYSNVVFGSFLSRPNRFIAKVMINSREETVHVKNTGRCRELLTEGCDVILSVSDNKARKTKYDLVAVYKSRENKTPLLINMDSQIPNVVAWEWLKSGSLFSKDAIVRREVRYGDSRLDFYIEDGTRKAFLEVKGVTLEEDSIAMFPDAPTQRGVKHINELVNAVENGYEAYILFVVQMKEINEVRPNDKMHKEFGDALRIAGQHGVRVLAIDCRVTENSIKADRVLPVVL